MLMENLVTPLDFNETWLFSAFLGERNTAICLDQDVAA
jgi:hypothetical protein